MSALFMLDTDSVSFALRGEGGVGAAILAHRPSELCVSAITVAELRFRAAKRKAPKLSSLIDEFVASIAVLPFDDLAATRYGALAAELSSRGASIGDFDVLIAAHALAAGATLVTNNVKHFARVRDLAVENWR